MIDLEPLVRLAMYGLAFILLLIGGAGGFALASVINLGKLCL